MVSVQAAGKEWLMTREEDDRKAPEQLCVEMKGKNPSLLGPEALPILCAKSI